jgi:hypothetical protein
MINDQKNCGLVVFLTEDGDGAGSMGSTSTTVVDVIVPGRKTNLKAFLEDFYA